MFGGSQVSDKPKLQADQITEGLIAEVAAESMALFDKLHLVLIDQNLFHVVGACLTAAIIAAEDSDMSKEAFLKLVEGCGSKGAK